MRLAEERDQLLALFELLLRQTERSADAFQRERQAVHSREMHRVLPLFRRLVPSGQLLETRALERAVMRDLDDIRVLQRTQKRRQRLALFNVDHLHLGVVDCPGDQQDAEVGTFHVLVQSAVLQVDAGVCFEIDV